MSDAFLAIILYFQTLAGFGPTALGFIPVDSPISPPPPPVVLRVSQCPEVPYAP